MVDRRQNKTWRKNKRHPMGIGKIWTTKENFVDMINPTKVFIHEVITKHIKDTNLKEIGRFLRAASELSITI